MSLSITVADYKAAEYKAQLTVVVVLNKNLKYEQFLLDCISHAHPFNSCVDLQEETPPPARAVMQMIALPPSIALAHGD